MPFKRVHYYNILPVKHGKQPANTSSAGKLYYSVHKANKSTYYLLGICLLQQSAPEFVVVTRMDEDQLAIVGGEPVINDNVHPLTKVPEMEAENPGIAFAPALIRGNNLTKKGGNGRNDCKSWIPYFTDEYFILSE